MKVRSYCLKFHLSEGFDEDMDDYQDERCFPYSRKVHPDDIQVWQSVSPAKAGYSKEFIIPAVRLKRPMHCRQKRRVLLRWPLTYR